MTNDLETLAGLAWAQLRKSCTANRDDGKGYVYAGKTKDGEFLVGFSFNRIIWVKPVIKDKDDKSSSMDSYVILAVADLVRERGGYVYEFEKEYGDATRLELEPRLHDIHLDAEIEPIDGGLRYAIDEYLQIKNDANSKQRRLDAIQKIAEADEE